MSIRPTVYVVCDACGGPASDVVGDADEVRANMVSIGGLRTPDGEDLCRGCARAWRKVQAEDAAATQQIRPVILREDGVCTWYGRGPQT